MDVAECDIEYIRIMFYCPSCDCIHNSNFCDVGVNQFQVSRDLVPDINHHSIPR